MFDHCLYFQTTSLARKLESLWTQAFKPFDLTPAQAFMLRVIIAKEGLLQSQLAQQLGISRATATRTLDGLTTKGMVVRKKTLRDGRECAIFPSEEAKALNMALTTASSHISVKLKQTLGQAVFKETVNQLALIRKTLE